MASDEVVWQIINQGFCAYKVKTDKGNNFCRSEHNVTGFCNRQSCPLANSSYATVRSHPTKETIYLYIKTIERCHLPSKMWEKIKLSNNYAQALEQIDERLKYMPKFLVHKCKQRLTRLVQVAIRTKRLAAEDARLGEKIVPKLAPKIRGRERARERKAEAAAKIERTVETELLERLRNGAYGDQPLNVSEHIWKKVLSAMEEEGAAVRDKDLDKGIEAEEALVEEELEKEGAEVMLDGDEGLVEYVSDFDESDAELNDIEDWIGDESSDDEDDEDEDDEDDEEDKEDDDENLRAKPKTKAKAGDKRKRGRVTHMKGKKRKSALETEVVGGERVRMLAF